MNFFIFSYCKDYLKSKTIFKCIFLRHTSSGLNIWDGKFKDEYKFEIQKYWKDKIHEVKNSDLSDKNKFYILSMIPYPSGFLHLGHVRVYVTSDTIARFYRMQGKHVIHPIGWDAFGLPAENAAINNQIHPSEWTKTNIEYMRKQLYEFGCTFDDEVTTCDPIYYKWTQELFLKLYDKGLVYKKQKLVNWDPVDKTVLADEQIDVNNRSWRSGAIVEKKFLNQWFIKTTALASSLMEGLADDSLTSWKDIVSIQRHWIGECTGTQIDLQLITNIKGYPNSINLWTETPEYIENAKFIAISNENYLSKIEKISNSDKYRKLNVEALNPFTNKKLPIYVIDKESIEYPNNRDEYLGIPISNNSIDCFLCKIFGINYEEIQNYTEEEILKKKLNILEIAKQKQIGGYWVSSKLQDWLISRQRYWGTPIPMTYCEQCGYQPVPRDQLPVVLPKVNMSFINQGLKSAYDWVKAICSKCNGSAIRETDTMDTFVDSSWYFMRMIDPQNENEMFSIKKALKYLPVDLYIGGKEHATLHLYYARFVSYFLHNLDLVPTKEPFKNLLVQGMVMSQTYTTKDGKYVQADDVIKINNNYKLKGTNESITQKWEKMSKSKNNSIDPLTLLSTYSIDTIRLYIMSGHAPTSVKHWSMSQIHGILNWEQRLWKIVSTFRNARIASTNKKSIINLSTNEIFEMESNINDNRNYYLHGVTFNIINSQQFSIAITKMQGLTKFLNSLLNKFPIEHSREFERTLGTLIIMIAPLAPHYASGLWDGFSSAPKRICNDTSLLWNNNVLQQSWPKVDDDYKTKVYVRVNDKELFQIRVTHQKLQKMANEENFLNILSENKLYNEYMKDKVVNKINLVDKSGGIAIEITTVKLRKKIESLA